jgi:hypothetical protein
MTEHLIRTIAETQPDVETCIMDLLQEHYSGGDEREPPTNQEIRRKLNQQGCRASKELVNRTLYRLRERGKVDYQVVDGGNKRWSCL